jgi:hypothetical protein
MLLSRLADQQAIKHETPLELREQPDLPAEGEEWHPTLNACPLLNLVHPEGR